MDNLQVYKVYDTDTIDEIRSLVESIDEPRWIKRTELQPGRAIKDSTCSYEYCNHVQMPKELREYFKKIAPVYRDFFLSEIAINKYQPGDYIGPHRDRHDFRRNLVVSLQTSNDGLLIDETDQFIRDEAGQGVLIEGIGPIHSVPSTTQVRYSLIFLYE